MTTSEQQIASLWGFAQIAIGRGALQNPLTRAALIMLCTELAELDVHARLGGTVERLQTWIFGFDPEHQPS